MGLNINPDSVFGWEINEDWAITYLVENKVGTCIGEYDDDGWLEEGDQCTCGFDSCWEQRPALCTGINIVFVHYHSDRRAFLSVLPEVCDVEGLSKMLADQELLYRAKTLAIALGASEEKKAELISVVNVT